jgi:hypothetical protein
VVEAPKVDPAEARAKKEKEGQFTNVCDDRDALANFSFFFLPQFLSSAIDSRKDSSLVIKLPRKTKWR